jgi:superfamily II DNA or RNA helicase
MIRVEDLDVPEGLKAALRREGVQILYPHQEEAIRRGLLEGRNMVVTAPTASGKTLLAILAAYRAISLGKKALYLTPLRALTSEKLAEFVRVFGESGLNFKVRAVSGDYDDPGEWLADYDLIVSTYEKADSLVRHGASWLGKVGLVVVDEVHMVGDRDRGPTLEMTVAKLQEVCGDPSFLCLSATVRNGEELAGWLEAELVKSDFRPVPLIEGVLAGGRLLLSDGTSKTFEGSDPLMEVVADSLRDGGQVLVFAMTRKRAEEYAAKIAGSLLELGDDGRLEEYAREVMEERESPFSERLASLIRRGVAFHHAGLSYHHRRTVEDAFRSRALRVLCSTTTLAAGVNLPARTVIIPEYRKFRGPGYVEELTVMEYKQLSGRAGKAPVRQGRLRHPDREARHGPPLPLREVRQGPAGEDSILPRQRKAPQVPRPLAHSLRHSEDRDGPLQGPLPDLLRLPVRHQGPVGEDRACPGFPRVARDDNEVRGARSHTARQEGLGALHRPSHGRQVARGGPGRGWADGDGSAPSGLPDARHEGRELPRDPKVEGRVAARRACGPVARSASRSLRRP